MAYSDDIAALGAQHHWTFDGDLLDSIGSADGTGTSWGTAGTPIAEDATGSGVSNATSDAVSIPTTTDINDSAQSRKVVAGWFMVDSVQLPPKTLYAEGNTTNVFQFVMGLGNNVMLEARGTSTAVQAYGIALVPNRAYHLAGRWEGDGFSDEVTLLIDGVAQSGGLPTGRAPGVTTLSSRGAAEFGGNGSGGVGGTSLTQNSVVTGYFQHWCTFDSVGLTDQQIREELFEKGALPAVTISTDTPANMQTALDALADTVRPNAPLCIRVQPPSGGGDLSLTADNITFDPLASLHVQWTGAGTLTWTNTNGANASLGSAPNGTINLVTPATLTVTGLPVGTEVRVYEAGTQTEVAGVESSGTSFNTSIQVSSVDIRLVSLDFQIKTIQAVDMTGGDVTLQAGLVVDRQYAND